MDDLPKHKYRVHFSANFDYDIEAGDNNEARRIATDLAAMPTIMLNAAVVFRCGWVTITPLDTQGRLPEDRPDTDAPPADIAL